MDMWDPYIKATREGLPTGPREIVFDRFHIMQDMTTAVDLVRKQEHRTLLRDDGRLGADRLQVPVAVQPTSDCRTKHARAICRPASPRAESRPSLGDQRSVAHPLDLPTPGRRRASFNAGLIGRAVAGWSRSAEVAATLKRHVEGMLALLSASDHQWRDRRHQQQDHDHQAESLRLSQPAELQNRDLLSLRRARSLPTLNPEAPNF